MNLFEAYKEEAAELLAGLRATKDPRELLRLAHTLKGATRAAGGLDQVEELAHALEGHFLGEGEVDVARTLDAIEDLLFERAPRLRVGVEAMDELLDRVYALGSHVESQERHAAWLDEILAEMATLQDGGHGVRLLQRRIQRGLATLRTDLNRLRSTVGSLSEIAGQIRLVTADSLFGDFGPMVREIAASQSKDVRYVFTGGEVTADREVLQALREPLLHLLRNAVFHGVVGSGTVELTVASHGSRLVVRVADDGPGLDREGLARAARAAGVSEHDALFSAGVSTSGRVDKIGGRGLGTSIVAEAARRLQGTVRVESGRGTTFELDVPLTRMQELLVLVRCGTRRYAVSADWVRRCERVTVSGGYVAAEEGMLPAGSFESALGLPYEGTGEVALIVPGMALLVDEILGLRRTVVFHAEIPGGSPGWLSGAILLEDETVCPVAFQGAFRTGGLKVSDSRPVEVAVPQVTKVLVVDDSITSRTLERAVLEAAGYRVTLAVDGLDALSKLRRARADVVVSDVNMPRLDGFGLLERMARDPALATIPVILLTSRDSEGERARGMFLGARAYLIKQKFDQTALLAAIAEVV